MARISRENIMDATLVGLNKAQENYLKWTGDNFGVSTGAEYVLTTYVAEQVFKIHQNHLYIEQSITELLGDIENSTKLSQQELNQVRNNGRTDIAIYKNSKPKAIIELKNNVSRLNTAIKDDIKRIKVLVEKDVIEFGIFAFVTEVEKKKNFEIKEVEEKIHASIMACKNEAKGLRYKYKYEVYYPEATDDTYWAWGSCVLLLF